MQFSTHDAALRKLLHDRMYDGQRALQQYEHEQRGITKLAQQKYDEATRKVIETRKKAQQTGDTEDENAYISACQERRMLHATLNQG